MSIVILENFVKNDWIMIWKYKIRTFEQAFEISRYQICLNEGLQPVTKELLTSEYTPRPIPEGCYDTGDGFYNPNTKCVISAEDQKKILRLIQIKIFHFRI